MYSAAAMLSLKLQRIGRRHQPAYRVVVAESRSKLIAPPIEDLGSYNPFTKAFNVKADRVTYWIGVGAQPTVTVHNLLAKNGVTDAKPRKIAMPPKAVVEEPEAPAAAPVEDAVADEPVVEEAAPAEEAPAEPAAEEPAEEPAQEEPAAEEAAEEAGA